MSKRRRRLRKSIRYSLIALIVLNCLVLCYGLFSGSFDFWGVKSVNADAAKRREGDCLFFYPGKSEKAANAIQMMCEGAQEKTVVDYTESKLGDYTLVDYGKISFLIDGQGHDIRLPDELSERQNQIIRDYFFYALRSNHRDEAKDLSLYENSVFTAEIQNVENNQAVLYYPQYDVKTLLPLTYLQKEFSMNLGQSDQAYEKPYYLDAQAKYLCLTFDDGPYLPISEKIVGLLDKYDISATFFVLGNRLGEKELEFIKRNLDRGIEYGSHTQSHKDLKTLSDDEMRKEVQIPYNDVLNATGYKMKFFRPPYGSYQSSMDEKVSLSAVLWTVDSRDWALREKSAIISEIHSQMKNDGILLCHDIVPATAEAMETLIPEWIEQGYQLVNVSQYLELKNAQQ